MVLCACSPSGNESVPPPSASPSDPLPFLLVRTEPDGGGLDALVHGVLRVNANSCVVLNDSLLSAPVDSRVMPDGRGVSLAGVGEYAFGDKASLRGVKGSRELSDEMVRRCGVSDMTVIFRTQN